MGACAAKQTDDDEQQNTEQPEVEQPQDDANYGAGEVVPGGGYELGGVQEDGQVLHNYEQGQGQYPPMEQLQQEFAALDTDKSGRLEYDEYAVARGADPAPPVVNHDEMGGHGGYEQGQIIYEDQNQGYNPGHVSYDQGYDQGNVVDGGYDQGYQGVPAENFVPGDHVKPAQQEWAPQMPVYSHNRQVMVSEPMVSEPMQHESVPQMRGHAVEEQYVEAQTLPQPMAYDHEPQHQQYEPYHADQGNYQVDQGNYPVDDQASYGYAVAAPSQQAPPEQQAVPAHMQAAH